MFVKHIHSWKLVQCSIVTTAVHVFVVVLCTLQIQLLLTEGLLNLDFKISWEEHTYTVLRELCALFMVAYFLVTAFCLRA